MNRICRCYGLESSLSKQCRFELFQVETFPVVRGVAVLDYCLDVFRRRVTHIAVPAVLKRLYSGVVKYFFIQKETSSSTKTHKITYSTSKLHHKYGYYNMKISYYHDFSFA